jgi:hypothetical protein
MFTRSSTSPAPGCGCGISAISACPGAVIRKAFIIFPFAKSFQGLEFFRRFIQALMVTTIVTVIEEPPYGGATNNTDSTLLRL